ncbi:LamG-like jellyroll fold domain-containing protein [Nocardioides sp. LHG3406-4]|uniref:LamG-like jellyroll fold domain-containing protein n=1 Tax=Nocardioides sp. LHG3406-4 TaxID=2804575 RepID=UPI003CEFDC3E
MTRRVRLATAITATAAVAVCGVATAAVAGLPLNPFGTAQMGHHDNGRILLSTNQWISPLGDRTTFSSQSMGAAISPDGTKVAVQTGGTTSGSPALNVLDASTGAVLQTIAGAGLAAPVYSPDGTALYVTSTTSVRKFAVGADGKVTNPTAPVTIGLSLPISMAVSADGKSLYVAENGTNKLAIVDTATNEVTGEVAVGNAPDGIAVVGNQVFVSNRGGRTAVAGDTTNNSYGTAIVSDPKTGASTTGTVSVVDPTSIDNSVTVPATPDTSTTPPDVVNIDFADGTPAEHAQNLPAKTYGTPTIAMDAGLGQNVATFNGVTDAYTYPFADQFSKVSKSFTVECKFRWNGAPAPTSGTLGTCESLNGGGIGVDILNGHTTTYAHVGGGYKTVVDPKPVVPGTWYHVVATWDGSMLRQYVNGKQVAAVAASGALGLPNPANTRNWTIGANAAATFEGPARVSVAVSKVWSTALPSSGTVSVPTVGKLTDTIAVGLQPTSATVHDGSVFVANTNDDTVSVIDAETHEVTQTFNVEPLPGNHVGASPNSVTFAGPNTLLVSSGSSNAIAQYEYKGPRIPVKYLGLIPTDAYPNQVLFNEKLDKVVVSNQHGIETDGAPQTYAYKGTVTSFTVPDDADLATTTRQVFVNNGWDNATTSQGRSGNSDAAAGKGLPAIPKNLGQPSAIKHVFLLIKENRTYDQQFGDIAKGNGDPTRTNFGERVTPNQHKLANDFTLFDNFYDSGMLSADGHNWLVQADNNDYQYQNGASAWVRSYPYNAGDALTYQRNGFIWDAALAAGKTVKNYGEYEEIGRGSRGTWQQYYAASQIMEGKATGDLPVSQDQFQSSSDVPSLNEITNPDYPLFDNNIPDQYRVDVWLQDFKKAEETGELPNLTIMQLPNDHTGGRPTPAAQVADNDLATGRVIDAVSHSRFWKDSAIFVLEDDTQAGSDHVDGHRGPLMIASPYAKRDVVNSEYISQINLVKTIEQILGVQPMNQMDRAALPMFSSFTNTPDNSPFEAVANQVPLTEGVTGLLPLTPAASATAAEAAALASTTGAPVPAAPAGKRAIAAAWGQWYKTVAMPMSTGPHGRVDAVNPAQMSRYGWYTSTGWAKAYPGDTEILGPTEVPGRNVFGNLAGE